MTDCNATYLGGGTRVVVILALYYLSYDDNHYIEWGLVVGINQLLPSVLLQPPQRLPYEYNIPEIGWPTTKLPSYEQDSPPRSPHPLLSTESSSESTPPSSYFPHKNKDKVCVFCLKF